MSALAALEQPSVTLENLLENPPAKEPAAAPRVVADADILPHHDPRLPGPVAQVVAERRKADLARRLAIASPLLEEETAETVTPHGAPSSWFLNAAFDQLTLDEALGHLDDADPEEPFRYVSFLDAARLNTVMREGAGLSRRYIDSWMTLCSGHGLSMAAGWSGARTPVVPVQDLTRALLQAAADSGESIAIIGSDGPEITRLIERYRFANLSWFNPPLAERATLTGLHNAAAAVARANARYTLLCLGWPYDEAVAQVCANRGVAQGIGICVGDAVDRIAHEPADRRAATSDRGAVGRSLEAFEGTLNELPTALKLWRRAAHMRSRLKKAQRIIERQRKRAQKASAARKPKPTREQHKVLAATS